MTKKNQNGTILLTGGGGYIGSILVQSLLASGYKVKVIDCFFFGQSVLNFYTNQDITIIKKDIRDTTKDDFLNVDAVIDLAALSNDPTGELDPELTENINTLGRLHVCINAKTAGVKHYVYVSSCSVYGKTKNLGTENSILNPLTTYARANAHGEKKVLKESDADFPVTVVRLATAYGLSRRMRFDLVLNLMTLDSVRQHKINIFGDGLHYRPMIHVADIASALIAIIESDKTVVQGEVFNVGTTSENFTIKEIAEIIHSTIPEPTTIEYLSGGADDRSYRIDFNKIHKSLGFKTNWTLQDGALEVYEALKRKKIAFSEKTVTILWYKKIFAQQLIKLKSGRASSRRNFQTFSEFYS